MIGSDVAQNRPREKSYRVTAIVEKIYPIQEAAIPPNNTLKKKLGFQALLEGFKFFYKIVVSYKV